MYDPFCRGGFFRHDISDGLESPGKPVGIIYNHDSSPFQKPAGLADGLGLESALSDNEIRPDFLVPPHPGIRDLGLNLTIFPTERIVKMM
jgi:hypothetical protein